jgi:hypothetical protein
LASEKGSDEHTPPSIEKVWAAFCEVEDLPVLRHS